MWKSLVKFSKGSKVSRRLGYVLASVHIVLFCPAIWLILIDDGSAQWDLLWIYFSIIDWPLADVVYYLQGIIPPTESASHSGTIWDISGFWIPALFYGILGPLCYYMIPQVGNFVWNLVARVLRDVEE